MTRKIKGFVLSTGRTGTVAITNVLNTDPNVRAIHEPSPSRRFHVFSRLYLEGKLKKEILAKMYFKSRNRIVSNMSETYYIEVNPFIWGFGDIFCEMLDSPKILHIVRDIRTYIASILNFKAKGWHRYVIDFFPFWHIKVSRIIKDIDDWNSLTFEEKASWRWVLINKTIDENENRTPNYFRVQFEDVFTQNEAVQKDSLEKIYDFFDIDLNISISCEMLQKKFNPSIKRDVKSFESFDKKLQESILDITAPLLKKYGYW